MDAIGIVQGDIAARWRNGECGDETFADFIAQALHREREAAFKEAAQIAYPGEWKFYRDGEGEAAESMAKAISAALLAKVPTAAAPAPSTSPKPD